MHRSMDRIHEGNAQSSMHMGWGPLAGPHALLLRFASDKLLLCLAFAIVSSTDKCGSVPGPLADTEGISY